MSDDDSLAFPPPRIERSEWVRAADRLRAELAALRAERDGLIENNRSLANSCRTYKDERDALRAENERLRTSEREGYGFTRGITQ